MRANGFQLIKGAALRDYAALLAIWIGLLVLFGALAENFLSRQTFNALANRIPTLAVVSAGMTLVLIIGGIDLSVGSVLGFSGALLGCAMVDWHWPLWASGGLCLGVGLLAGIVNGGISCWLGIPSFIVTLGMLEVARGLAYLTTHSQTKYIGGAVTALSEPGPIGGVSASFLISMLVVVAGQIMLSFTIFGRHLLAIGSNPEAARLSGIRPIPAKVAVFTLLGLCTALGAIFFTSRLGSADPNAGVGLELSAIAAVVIGGTSLMGGRGSIIKSFVGVLIIATLEAGLAQVGASEPVKRVVTGLVIVVAVIVDAWREDVSRFKIGRLKSRLFNKA